MVGFAGSEDRDLSHAVAVRNVVFDEHFPESVRWCKSVDIAVVVVRPDLSDDGNLARGVNRFALPVAPFNDWKPEPQVNGCITGQACASVSSRDGRHGDVNGANLIDGIRTVHAHPCVNVRVVVHQPSAVPRLRIQRRTLVHGRFNGVFTKAASKHARGKEQHHQQRFDVHATTG